MFDYKYSKIDYISSAIILISMHNLSMIEIFDK